MKFCAVLVLYERDLRRSETFLSCAQQFIESNIPLLVYDNSKRYHVEDIPDWLQYFHDPGNGGLTRAYNYALSLFKDCDWLITLDQDTILPDNFLSQTLMSASISDNCVVAIVPNVFSNGIKISPSVPSGFASRFIKSLSGQGARFINSGACLSIPFLLKIGGYPNFLTLDYIDVWLSDEIYKRKKNILVGKVCLEHELSISKLTEVKDQRLISIFREEFNYYSSKNSFFVFILYKMRLVLRLTRIAIKPCEYEARYLKLLLKYIFKLY